MIKNIDNLLSDNNVDEVAKYIIDRFLAYDDNDKKNETEFADLDFDLHKGKMKSLPKNTKFFFDVEKGDILYDIVHAFYTDDESILPGDEEKALLDELEEDFNRLEEFLEKVKVKLQSEFSDSIRDAIRKNLMEGAMKELFPMERLEIKDLHLSNPVFPYTLKILRGRTIAEMEDKSKGKRSVAKELLNEHLTTGKDFETIIAEKKAIGDSDYRYVFGVDKMKSEYNCHIYMWVDYSLVEKPENVAG